MIEGSKKRPKLTTDIEEKILCAYQNLSNSWQIIKITDVPNYYWEKVVLPGQEIVFQGISQANLNIFSADYITSILIDTIPCHKLKTN